MLTFEVIGGPYPRFGSWSGRLQRLWAWATPLAVHERVRDRAWQEGFKAGRCARAASAGEPHALVEPAVEPSMATEGPGGFEEPFPWVERFKARLATGEPMPSPDRPEGERLALALLGLPKCE